MTNFLYKASLRDSSPNKVKQVLIRIYGNKTELIIDHQRELENIKRLYPKGFGPKLYGVFENGYIYEYYEGRCLSPEELHNCAWNERLGTQLALWHTQEPAGEQETGVWKTINNWLSLIPDSYGAEKDKKFNQYLGKAKIEKELAELKAELLKVDSPVIFAHNDLLAGNVIVHEETGTIKFIDFEYADANYRGFDIANHFNEWAGFEADYSRYPEKEQQYQFYRTYLSQYLGTTPTEKDLHALYVEVNKFALLSHFYWGTWALVQAAISTIDFDFLDYGILRFNEYFRRKSEFLSLA
jgi:ethanolamine kinase